MFQIKGFLPPLENGTIVSFLMSGISIIYCTFSTRELLWCFICENKCSSIHILNIYLFKVLFKICLQVVCVYKIAHNPLSIYEIYAISKLLSFLFLTPFGTGMEELSVTKMKPARNQLPNRLHYILEKRTSDRLLLS